MFPVLNVMSCQSFNSFSILGYQLGETPLWKSGFYIASDYIRIVLIQSKRCYEGVWSTSREKKSPPYHSSFLEFLERLSLCDKLCFFLKIGTKRAAKSTFIKFDLTAVSFYVDNISNKAHDNLLIFIISYFHKKHKVFSRHENDFMVLQLVIFICFVH